VFTGFELGDGPILQGGINYGRDRPLGYDLAALFS
jgi:hypothetical protein